MTGLGSSLEASFSYCKVMEDLILNETQP